MPDKGGVPYLAGLGVALLAAVAGYVFGQYKTKEQEAPNMTIQQPPPPCGAPTSHAIAGSLLKGVTLDGDGMPLPSAYWSLHPATGAHTLTVTNHGNTAIQVDLVQLYDNVDNSYKLSDSLLASCNFPTLTNPGCTSLAASGGSCSFTIHTTRVPLTTYLLISTPIGGMEVSIPILP